MLTGLALMAVSLLIAAATGLAALPSPFALAPAALALVALLALRRSPAKIAEALAARS